MTNALIIGCGYLGQRVGAILCQKGGRVFGTVRSPARAAEIVRLGIEPVIADVLDLESLRGLPDAECVFYSVGFDRTAKATMRSVYIDGLQNVLDRLPSQTARVVYASSTGVYGQTGGEWVDEESATNPMHESGQICLEAERRVRAWSNSRDELASAIILRFAGLYGPGRVVRRSMVERGEPIPGDPAKFLNLIHIDDAAQAAIAALETTSPDFLYVIADDRPVSRQEYYSLIAGLVGAPEPSFEVPQPGALDAHRDATNKRVRNQRMRERLGLELRYPDITAGLPACLDWERRSPVP
jgi:nucleoside-diphosphate-sugar epimerase